MCLGRERREGSEGGAWRIFTACCVVLWQGAVLLHKSVQKVSAHVLQPVPGQADGMK